MSFVDHIIQSAPKDSNPYAFAAEFVATIVPPKPDWYFSNIIAVGVIAAMNLISTIVSFFLMWRRSRAGSGVGLWFFKTQYGHSSGIPYIVPNALTMFLFWNLIFMLLMQPYIWLNYFAYHSPNLELVSRMYFWYGFVFIWDSVGMWTSAFGTLYATLLPKLFTITPSEHSTIKNTLLHPITLNALCFLPPIGLAITQIVTSMYSSAAWSNIVHTQFKLVDILTTLATQWSSSGVDGLQKVLLEEATKLGALFLEQKEISQTAFQRNAGTCAIWYLLCVVLFTPTAIWLLCALRSAMKLQVRRVTPHLRLPVTSATDSMLSPRSTAANFEDAQSKPPFSPGRASFRSGNTAKPPALTGTTDCGTANVQTDSSLRQLRRAYYTVGLQSIGTLFCMISTAGSWLWVCIDAPRVIVNPTLHAFAILFTIWVFAIVGCLANLFILIRTYRTYRTPHTSAGNVVPMSPMRGTHMNSATHSEFSQKPVFIQALTTTHTVVDGPNNRSITSESGHDLGLQQERGLDKYSAYSVSSVNLSGKGISEERDVEERSDGEQV